MSTPRLLRSIAFERLADAVADGAPIPCTIATQTPVQRYGVSEVLDCSETGVDLSRSPLPLIISHDSQQLSIGLVENLRALGDRVVGEVRFASSEEAQQVRADVLGGIHRSLSVGYLHLDDGSPIEGGLMFRWRSAAWGNGDRPASHRLAMQPAWGRTLCVACGEAGT